ncbi:MAG: hypothetical protein KC656_22050 [Myxococcales bacterium]|nr:hypothetical protein [Myxococcales bacterium]MCB9670428.1 hypothetical protein [Alphaproteobacteria bacterium]
MRVVREATPRNLAAAALILVHPFTILGFGWTGYFLDAGLTLAGSQLLTFRALANTSLPRPPEGLRHTHSGFEADLPVDEHHRMRKAEAQLALWGALASYAVAVVLTPWRTYVDFEPLGGAVAFLMPELLFQILSDHVLFIVFFGWGVVFAHGLRATRGRRESPVTTVRLDGRLLEVDGAEVAVSGRPRDLDRVRGVLTVDGLEVRASIGALLWLEDQLARLADGGSAVDVPEALGGLRDQES